jgi:(p)ppGpp synthase/HD superfamily hydrolase
MASEGPGEERREQSRFARTMPRALAALEFADEHHAGQRREVDDAPFVMHPQEVAGLLHDAGYEDEVVAAGVLHDVIEDTSASRADIEERFGPEVARLVVAVSDDPSIEDAAERKAALRLQVAEAGENAAVIFAADKVSKARELRLIGTRGPLQPGARLKLDHYRESLDMLDQLIPGHELVRRLRSELERIEALPTRA